MVKKQKENAKLCNLRLLQANNSGFSEYKIKFNINIDKSYSAK